MSNTPQIPQVPSIAPIASAADGISTASDIGMLMAPIVSAANQTTPDPYIRGTQAAEPHLKHIVPASQYDDHRTPITGGVADIKRARRQNSVAGLANMIGSFGQKIQEKKQAALKDRLVDVMKYKNNTENAQQVLSDPNSSDTQKQMAQKVFDANKKQLNDILSDPKHQKEMAKALDISFVDPEKNKTPEVQAYQQAMKEYKEAGAFKSDNPQEHAVAQAASGEQPAFLKAEGGGQQQQQQAAPSVKQQQSATPYADAALKKDSPTIAENPQYAAIVKQKEEAQKKLSTMIPHLIDAQSKALIEAAKDQNSAGREMFKAASEFRKAAMDDITKLNIADKRDETTLRATAMRDSAELASARIRADASIKVAETNGLSREQVQTIRQTGALDLDKHINSTETALKTYGQREADIKNSDSLKPEEKKQQLDVLNYQKEQDEKKLTALQDMRAKQFPDIPMPQVTPPPPPDKSTFEKLYNYLESNFGGKKDGSPKPESAKPGDPTDQQRRINAVGADESDESSDDSSEDSDSFGSS